MIEKLLLSPIYIFQVYVYHICICTRIYRNTSARRIIQETNSAIVSKRIAKSRQMTLRDFGMK